MQLRVPAIHPYFCLGRANDAEELDGVKTLPCIPEASMHLRLQIAHLLCFEPHSWQPSIERSGLELHHNCRYTLDRQELRLSKSWMAKWLIS